jgi:hypothetical protein
MLLNPLVDNEDKGDTENVPLQKQRIEEIKVDDGVKMI